jgi:AmmeMemoRadiSam system protein A
MPSLSDSGRRALLQLARQAVVDAVHERLPQQIPHEGVFSERSGVFVTLHIRHRLRGCIGVIEAEEPLGESIVRCAASAALQDPRFTPMRADELGELQIEISLLSPPAPIRPEEIEIGRHGLLVSRGKQRGLLLPQVAAEQHFSPDQFLQETCRKAQLPRDAWRETGTQVLGFTCEVFSEEAGRSVTEP